MFFLRHHDAHPKGEVTKGCQWVCKRTREITVVACVFTLQPTQG